MEDFRPGRAVRVLVPVLSVVWVAGWALLAVLIVAVAGLELFADRSTLGSFAIGVPARLDLAEVRVPATWNGATGTVGLDDAVVSLDVPLSLAPASFRLLTYGAVLLGFVVALLFLHQLRGLFQSARLGVPFEVRNAARLRRMAGLLVAGHVLAQAVTAWQASSVVRRLGGAPVPIGLPFPLDERLVFEFDERVFFAALLLLALAEIFRRGAALEDEQSLVV